MDGQDDTFNCGSDIAALVLDTIPIGIIFCGRDCIIRYINKSYAGYLGIDKSEALGRKITDFIPDSRASVVLEKASPEFGDICHIRRGEEQIALIVNRLPVKDDEGTIIGFLSQTLFGDPHDLKRLAEKIDDLDKKVAFYKRRYKSALSAVYTLDTILGQSAVMARVKEHLRRYAGIESPVLIYGLTGTGKELFASALHRTSTRSEGPFVSLNCAAMPQDLVESELFGYAPGSFTGAHRDGKIGQIELADMGTLFLDEIGDMPLQTQVKLLRVIEDKIVFRVGSHRPHKVDFRIVAATNRDLRALIKEGKFREDLYFRISALQLTIPPLLERREDIPLLVCHFLDKIDRADIRFSDEAMDCLIHYSWPGNVRELRNVVISAVSLCRSQVIESIDLPPEIATARAGGQTRKSDRAPLTDYLQGSEHSLILNSLRQNNWNMVRSAKSLGISRATLYEKTKKYGITRAS